jgi:hypothetical protein
MVKEASQTGRKSSSACACDLVLVIAALLMIAGCDSRPERVPIAGQVKINGQPLTTGYIRFVPVGSRPSGSQIDQEGRFRLTCYDDSDGAVLGKHRVEVVANYLDYDAGKMFWHAPKKYASAQTSGLEVEVTDANENLVIELQSTEKLPMIDPEYVQ